MAFDFPSSPTAGDIFTDTASGAQYYWNGVAWTKGYSEPGTGIAHPPAETIPVEPPIDGADNVNDVLTNFSVEIDQLTNDSAGKVDIAGHTMTGALILSEHPTAASPDLQAATKGYVAGIGGLPPGGTIGQALVIDPSGIPTWGAAVEGGNF